MPEHLKKKHDTGIEQRKQLMPKLEAAEKEFKTTTAAMPFYIMMMSSNAVDAKGLEQIKEFANRSKATETTYQDLKREFDYLDSPTYYLSGAPTPVGVVKTDADGKFTFSIPSGKYVIVATSSRKVDDVPFAVEG